MNKITITGLYKTFGAHIALNKISLSANKGDVVVLLGSSGSGKSALLRCIKSLATLGMTMFIATNEIGFAKEIATHAIFLENGDIIEQGAANEMLNQPKTDRLKQFLDAVKY